MGFLNGLFKKGEKPEKVISDEVLGELVWEDDCEAWAGSYNGLKFDIGYDYEKMPKQGVLEHARKLITDLKWLSGTLELAKNKALNEYPPEYKEEINRLVFKKMCFFNHERLHIQFYENDDEPLWFAEVMKGKLEHIGFDT